MLIGQFMVVPNPTFQIMFAILGFAVIFLDIKLASQGKERMGISPKPFFVILFL